MGVAAPEAEPLAPPRPILCGAGFRSLLLFTLILLAVSLTLSAAIMPLSGLVWWRAFRRCVSIGAAVSLWVMIRKVQRRSFRSYGLVPFREGKRDLLFGLALGAGSLAVLLAIGFSSGACIVKVIPDQVRLWRTVIGFIPAVGLVALIEELVFRGFILQNLLGRSRWLAIGASSAAYALVHLRELPRSLPMWQELLGLALLGVLLSLTVLRTRTLWLAMGLHAVLAYGARVNKLIISFPVDYSWMWLTGTSRLVNGLAAWIALVVMGWLVVWWTNAPQRRRITE